MLKRIIIVLILICNVSWAEVSPEIIGQPARLQAMGMTADTIEGSISNLFFNPAAISNASSWEFMSMYGKVMNELDYSVIGSTFSWLGINWGVGANIISAKTVPYVKAYGSSDGIPDLGYSDYTNELYQFSFSKAFGDENSLIPLRLGGALKLYRAGLSGHSTFTSSGYGADFGLVYNVLPNVNCNIAIKDMFASREWETGRKEDIPQRLNVGLSSDWFESDLVLNLNVEMDEEKSLQLMNVGAEYTVQERVSLRAGLRQRPWVDEFNKATTQYALTLGAGYRLGDFRFDYAYVPYAELEEDVSHFFTISYEPFRTRKEKYDVNLPEKGKWFYDSYVLVSGHANRNIADVKVNANSVKRRDDNSFEEKVELKYQENDIIVVAKGKRGKLYKQKTKVFALKQFVDIPKSYKGHANINLMYTYDILKGDVAQKFYPNEPIERSKFVAAVMKLKGKVKAIFYQQKTKKDLQFKAISEMLDFDRKDWASEFIAQARRDNIVVGYPDATIRQKNYITRAEALVIMARIEKMLEKNRNNGIEGSASEISKDPLKNAAIISWVDPKHWAYSYAKYLASKGFLDYIDDNKRYIVENIFTSDERDYFYSYIASHGYVGLENIDDYLASPQGSQIFYMYLHDTEFIKKPIQKFELVELITKSDIFNEFVNVIGINMH